MKVLINESQFEYIVNIQEVTDIEIRGMLNSGGSFNPGASFGEGNQNNVDAEGDTIGSDADMRQDGTESNGKPAASLPHGGVAWIGDSQTVAGNGAWPRGVFGGSVKYFGMVSANPSHYMGVGLSNKKSTNIQGVSTCKQALDAILASKPSIVYIELGHNGANKMGELIRKIKSAGCKVGLIKVFQTHPKAGTGMVGFDREKSIRLYAPYVGMADKVIDLIDLKLKQSGDGVHLCSADFAPVVSATKSALA